MTNVIVLLGNDAQRITVVAGERRRNLKKYGTHKHEI